MDNQNYGSSPPSFTLLVNELRHQPSLGTPSISLAQHFRRSALSLGSTTRRAAAAGAPKVLCALYESVMQRESFVQCIGNDPTL